MAEYVTTIGGIFSSDPDTLPNDAVEALHADPSMRTLQDEVDRQAAGPSDESGDPGRDRGADDTVADSPEKAKRRTAMIQRVALAAGGLLAIGLYDDVFVKAWNEQKIFRKYTDPDSYDPSATIRVPMKPHEIKSLHNPKIEIRVNQQLVRTISFTIELALKLTGAEVTIRDGKILKAAIGKCDVHGRLKCGPLILADRDIVNLALVPETEFEEPIPVLPPWNPRAEA